MYPTKKLWEVCEIKKWKKVNYAEQWKYNYIDIGILRTNIIEQYTNDEWVFCNKNDILIAWDGSKSGTVGFWLEWVIGSTLAKITIDTKMFSSEFIGKFLQGNFDYLNKNTSGAAIPHLRKDILINLEIPLPPLPTQQKIVVKLDSLFEKLDQAITLTKQNLANIEELNKSILEKIFTECEEKYEKREIWEILDFIWSGFACNKSNETLDWYVHLRTHNIDTNWKLVFDTIIKINPEKVDFKKAKIKKWEILFNNTNSKELVWKTAYVEKDYDFWYSNHLTKLVVNNNNSARFITYFFNYLFFKNFFLNISNKWIGQAGINNTMVQKIPIPLPPLPEQQKIVEYLDNIFAENQKLKNLYQAQIKNLDEMKQSFLKKAFAGDLV